MPPTAHCGKKVILLPRSRRRVVSHCPPARNSPLAYLSMIPSVFLMLGRLIPMTLSLRALALVIAIAAATLAVRAVAQADPGLIAVYTDGKATVHRVVPTPNFTLSAKQSVHSQISPKFDAVYTGVLKISRGGDYTISGDASIEVDGKAVAGKTVKLAAGDHPLKIQYSRKADSARLQLRWKADFMIEEPIPPSAFAHSKPSDALTGKWAQIEHGRSLYENLSCGACHGAKEWNLSARRGPDLSNIGSRVTSDWLASWLNVRP